MMKKRILLKVLLCPLALLLLLQGCVNREEKPNESTKQQSGIVEYHTDMTYTYNTAVDESVLVTSKNAQYLLLANKQYALNAEYEPSALAKLPDDVVVSWHSELYLEERAATALLYMLDEMKAAGVSDVQVTSAYRTYAKQRSLFEHYMNEEQSKISQEAIKYFGMDYIQTHYYNKGLNGLNASDAKAVVLSYSAYPGTSEHQTGLCVDLITASMGTTLNERFEQTEAFAWLAENAHRFGFILRYPKGKENVTGYTYEPWHYRFVGREAATDIRFGNLTLEEYLSGQGIQV